MVYRLLLALLCADGVREGQHDWGEPRPRLRVVGT